jgi:diadenosine tetraphosphate (Ap4A) HIT family hydrolase
MEDFKEKFLIKELTVYKTEYWTWSIRPHQATLGASILSLNRTCTAFSGLSIDEYSDLDKIIKIIEKSISEAFDYDVINYLMLMMVDKQVHFHVIPRYKNERVFLQQNWWDINWPGVPNLSGEKLELNKLKAITDFFKNRYND